MLDMLSLTGEIGWARLSTPTDEGTHVVGATPVALFRREHADAWAALKSCAPDVVGAAMPERAAAGERQVSTTPRGASAIDADTTAAPPFRPGPARVADVLRARGALFVPEIAAASGLTEADVRQALADLVARGRVTSDGFGGLRAIIRTAGGRPLPAGARTNVTGRWSLIDARERTDRSERERAVEIQARALLRRYGIVFRKLLAREPNAAPWRELARVYRRPEARGEIRRGRFVTVMSGEQVALPGAVERLREVRRTLPSGHLQVISAADPLNLAGIVTVGERVRAVAATRIVYRDGVPLAAMEGDYVRPLVEDTDGATASAVATSLTGRAGPAVVSGFLGRS